MLNLTYTYQLKLTQQQSQTYEAWLETSRRVWNFALAERKDWYNSRSCRIDTCSLRSEYIIPADAPRPTFASQCKALTQARKTNPDLNAAHSQMLQQVLRRLEKAFIGMWESGRGFPRFKKQGRMRSLLFPQLGVLETRSLFCQGESGRYKSNLPKLQSSHRQERLKRADSSLWRMWIHH
jgi:putative transposase